MDVAKVVRCTGIAIALTFGLAVSSAFADGMGSRGYEGSLVKSDAVTHVTTSTSTGWNSGYMADTTFTADFNSNSFGLNEGFGRTDGIRDGQWMKLNILKYNDTNGWLPGDGGGSTVPEPGTFLLLANGLSGIWFIRRRMRRA